MRTKLITITAALIGMAVSLPAVSVSPGWQADAQHDILALLGSPLDWIEQRVVANDGQPNTHFGVSVALQGNTALVGAELATVDRNPNRGAAYVFTNEDGVWRQTGKLTASDGDEYDFFGHAIAMGGNTAIVSAYAAPTNGIASTGALYAFSVDSDGNWSSGTKFFANDSAAYDFLGNAVAIDGNTILVGAANSSPDGSLYQGSAYVFMRDSDGNWTQRQKLTASDGSAWAQFGWSVALEGSRAIVGAFTATVGSQARQGAAYVFQSDSDGNWYETQKLLASDGRHDFAFGSAVALQGNTALIGSQWTTANGNFSNGAAYVFRSNSDGHWSETQKLVAAETGFNDNFGSSIALDGQQALIGAYYSNFPGSDLEGAAYLYASDSDGVWSEIRQLRPSDGQACDQFGIRVALDNGTALVGSHYATPFNLFEEGAAYFYGDLAPGDNVFRSDFELAPANPC